MYKEMHQEEHLSHLFRIQLWEKSKMNKFNVLLLFIGNCCGCKISVNGYIGNANLLEFYRFYIVLEKSVH